MKKIIIEGNKLLSGTIKIGGAKNSAVALLPAAILSSGITKISSVPNISDKDAIVSMLEFLGASVLIDNNNFIIDSSKVENKPLPMDYCQKLRASYYFMGILLAKYKYAEVCVPGGCKIGTRPIDIHLKGFESLGATVEVLEDRIILKADNLVGNNINLPFASVGATINIMFAASMATGVTIIKNAAKEPEIVNIADMLISMGLDIKGAGTDTITIVGNPNLNGGNIKVVPDRIEAGTYIIMGALLGNDYKVKGVDFTHLTALLNKFDDMKIKYEISGDEIKINKQDNLNPVNIKSLIYPGFPTDLGQPMQVLLTKTVGTSFFEETIFENRMLHVKYLNKMGADINVNGKCATINGPTNYIGQKIKAGDLRGGAALVLAGLIAEGKTEIVEVEYILRGYENIISKLTKLGANIKIEEI